MARVSVINFKEIQRDAALYKGIRAQVDQYKTKFRTLIQSEENELRKADRELARQRAILSPEAYADERRKFEKRVVAFQHQGENMKRSLERSLSVAVSQANRAVKDVVDKFAAENGITLILLRENIAFSNPAMDITSVIIERLNTTTPTITVPDPQQQQQPQQPKAPNASK